MTKLEFIRDFATWCAEKSSEEVIGATSTEYEKGYRAALQDMAYACEDIRSLLEGKVMW